MKIFISHSSQDKWVARRLSQDLEALGITTFLDEKDIETGESIDDAIQKHLDECDEILMLLSPAALSSHWVLLEIGGAKALGKRLIPILLHVGPNDLPQPLAKGLARDLNDVEKYYEEVEQRRSGSTPSAAGPRSSPSSRRESQSRRRRTFKVGDVVKIPDRRQPDFRTTKGLNVGWVDDMDIHAGKLATVEEVDDDRTVLLDVDDGEWWWAMDWLQQVLIPSDQT